MTWARLCSQQYARRRVQISFRERVHDWPVYDDLTMSVQRQCCRKYFCVSLRAGGRAWVEGCVFRPIYISETCVSPEKVFVSVKSMSCCSIMNSFMFLLALRMVREHSLMLHFASRSSPATVITHAHGGAAPRRSGCWYWRSPPRLNRRVPS